MSTKVSMEKIAKKIGVSKNTVSLVFRNMPGVNEQTRAKVLEAAAQLGYTYNRGNSNNDEDSQTVTNIIIIIPSSVSDNGFFTHIQYGIESEAKKNNINTLISYYDDTCDVIDIPNGIKEKLVVGIITLGRVNRSVFSSLQSYDIPIIMVDHYYEDITLDCVLSDNFTGGYIAARHLIEKGHKEIGFLGPIHISVSFYDRFLGFKKALEQSNLSFNSYYVLAHRFEHLIIEESAIILEKLKKLHKLPSAFFCCNDIEAIKLIKGLSYLGIQVPQDISVIGFDDIDIAKNFYPELTTIKVSKELMGYKAVQRLLTLIEKKELSCEKTVLSVSLVERQSVRNLLK